MLFDRRNFVKHFFSFEVLDIERVISAKYQNLLTLNYIKVYAGESDYEFSNEKNKSEHSQHNYHFSLDLNNIEIYFDFEFDLVSKEIKNDVVNSLIEIECENLLLKSDNSFLEKYVYQDDLTCVFNYRKLCYDIVSSIQSSKLTGKRFCLVFIDIDNFKKINDQYGHFVGSSLLQQLSQLFTKILKKNFQIYRYGGDEFVFLCMNTTNEELIKELEFLKDEVSSIKFQLEKNKTYQMSLSAGYAEYPTHGKTLKEMIEIADKMMYESKKFKSQKVINLKKNG